MKLEFLDLRKEFCHHHVGEKDFKLLRVGIGGGVIGERMLSWDLKYTTLSFHPSPKEYYVYAKCPIKGKVADLISCNEEMKDDTEFYYLLIKKDNYENLNFK